jgi:hypothetical protein
MLAAVIQLHHIAAYPVWLYPQQEIPCESKLRPHAAFAERVQTRRCARVKAKGCRNTGCGEATKGG